MKMFRNVKAVTQSNDSRSANNPAADKQNNIPKMIQYFEHWGGELLPLILKGA